MATCTPCLMNLHLNCLEAPCRCVTCFPTEGHPEVEDEEDQRPSAGGKSRTRRLKRDDALKDQQSTGRKRAARLFPLDREAPCEWRGLTNCGGGTHPINGCIEGTQQARHHGPDKSVSNNESGNVHRICHRCHNRWHAANNKEYNWNNTTPNPHQPKPMTDMEKWWVQAQDEGLQFKAIKD
jgi:hypothetical protein